MLNKDPYNNKTYMINWRDVGTPMVKVFHTRSDARDFKAKLKQRLGKKWHEYIEMKQVVITQGFIESTKICR